MSGYALDAPTDPSLFKETGAEKFLTHHHANILDRADLKKVIEAASPDVIFHLAAQSIVRRSYENPIDTFKTNVVGTLNLLEVLRNYPKSVALVVVTSDKCYHNDGREQGYREEDSLGGDDPYSASKGATEIVANAYLNSFFKVNSPVRLASARAGNVIGGGDWALDRIIPDAARALSQNLPISVRNPNHIRPWQHVLEPLHGYLMLAERLAGGATEFQSAWNFGPDEADTVSVSEVVEKVIRIWGKGEVKETPEKTLKKEASLLRLDTSKAKERLAWKPKWNLDLAIEKTMHWYQEYYQDPSRALELCQAQIRDYQAS